MATLGIPASIFKTQTSCSKHLPFFKMVTLPSKGMNGVMKYCRLLLAQIMFNDKIYSWPKGPTNTGFLSITKIFENPPKIFEIATLDSRVSI